MIALSDCQITRATAAPHEMTSPSREDLDEAAEAPPFLPSADSGDGFSRGDGCALGGDGWGFALGMAFHWSTPPPGDACRPLPPPHRPPPPALLFVVLPEKTCSVSLSPMRW